MRLVIAYEKYEEQSDGTHRVCSTHDVIYVHWAKVEDGCLRFTRSQGGSHTEAIPLFRIYNFKVVHR